MAIAAVRKTDQALGGREGPSGVISRWILFFFCIFLIWVFMFIIAPVVEKSPAVKPLAQFIQDTGINASALYYTELDETADAEMYLRDMRLYAPERKNHN